jgi:hypothetical protein
MYICLNFHYTRNISFVSIPANYLTHNEWAFSAQFCPIREGRKYMSYMYLAACVKTPQVVKLNHFIYNSFVDIALLTSLSTLQTQTRELRHTNSDTTRTSQPIVCVYQCNHIPHRMNLMLPSVEFKSLCLPLSTLSCPPLRIVRDSPMVKHRYHLYISNKLINSLIE